MMFGHVETIEDRIEHLERVRAQQDKSRAGVPLAPRPCSSRGEKAPLDAECGVRNAERRTSESQSLLTPAATAQGFTAFICWTFQAEHTKLRAPTVGAHEYLRTQALSRIYLDNIANVQSSWVTQGQEIGQVA